MDGRADAQDLPAAPRTASAGTGVKVVGIGASAGGLESLEQLFTRFPAEPGMAFVVVQHLSPDFRSVMDELLARHSAMPVKLAEHGERVQENRVYLMPPKKVMIIRNGRLVLSDKDPSLALSLPIDGFFRSLGQDVGEDAAAVILSGSGSDGSRGLRDVKAAGGLVIAESPETAKFNGMPLSAQATGLVDHLCAPEDIARVLCGMPPQEQEPELEPAPPPQPMEEALRLLLNHFGIDFSHYKTSTVSRRIRRRASLLNLPDLETYVEVLRADTKELGTLYHDLLIGVTQFLRDPSAYAYLEKNVIPDIIEKTPPEEEIRVWVAGCATGEEAYSIAMLFYEQLVSRGRAPNLKILATDVHRQSLDAASAGIFQEDQLVHVSRARLERFFRKHGSGYQISQDLRQLIVFARHNVTKDAPFTKMHLITCRNLLIYLKPPAQKTVLSLFHFGLKSGGYLFLGASESPGALQEEFAALDEQLKIYRKRRDVQLLAKLQLPLPQNNRLGPPTSPLEPTSGGRGADLQLLGTYDHLLDRFMPPSFLVDDDRQLVDSFGGAQRLLHIKPRRPSYNILDLLDGDLRTVVAGAIQRALKERSLVRYTGVRVKEHRDGEAVENRYRLSAEPIVHRRMETTQVLITFERERPKVRSPETESADTDGADSESAVQAATAASDASQERVETLESELAYVRETLQATIEELETSNEEMQATNEELVASNEELQSTNEELHSVNEELYTVNAEHQKKIRELNELNSDMQHLLEGTDVGTIFLDRELRIRKFTPRIAAVFRIRPQDVGRRVSDFSHNIRRTQLMDEIAKALRGYVVEDEVRDVDGTPYFLRILPYRADDTEERTAPSVPPGTAHKAPIAGVVLTLTDITPLDAARARLDQLSAIVESSEDAIIGKDLDGTIISWNRGAEKLYGYTAEEVVGRSMRTLAPPGREHEPEKFLAAIKRGETVDHVQTVRQRKDGTHLDISVTVSPIYDREGSLVGASAIARDITQLTRARREVDERQEHIQLLLDSTAEAIFGIDQQGACIFVNPSCLRLLGYDDATELIGEKMFPLIHRARADGTPLDERECGFLTPLLRGEEAHSDQHVLWRKVGTSFDAEYWSHPIRAGDEVRGAVVTFLDITERKQAEEAIRTAARRREQFLAMLSHELRNPLAAVLNATKVMQLDAPQPRALAQARDVVERQSRHMARLLDDLLDVSRITRGKLTLHKQIIDLREAVEAATEATEPLRRERNVPLSVDVASDPLLVWGDPARLQQAVANLLTNAAHYSTAGEDIRLSVCAEGDDVLVKVTDHGMGIPSPMLKEIFELFVQSDQAIDRPHGGLGVGLTLVRSIAELHGGSVSANSEGKGHGSQFVIRFPRAPEREAGTPAETTEMENDKRRIVIVEDQDDARTMMRLLLEAKGHEVIEARDGPSGVQAVHEQSPDVALIDIGLPTMSGYQVAQKVREKESCKDTVLVALTGYGSDEDVSAARRAGFDRHLTKPASPEEIDRLLADTRPLRSA